MKRTKLPFKVFKDDNHTFKTCPTSEKLNVIQLNLKNTFTTISRNQFVSQTQKSLMIYQLSQIENGLSENGEIKTALKKLRNGKAANDIPAELLKNAVENEEILSELSRLYSDVWNQIS